MAKPNRSYVWKNLKFMGVLGFCSGLSGQELETTVKNQQNHQKPQQTTKTTVQTEKNQKNHHFQAVSQNPEFVVFFWFLQWF